MRDQPLILKSGIKIWSNETGFHRTDGPAIIYPNGSREWWINNQYICDIQDEFTNYLIQHNINSIL